MSSSHLPTPVNSLNVQLSEEQLAVLDQIPDMPFGGRLIFVTGRAGTGKSTLLRALVATTPLNHAIVAPTGIAAINVGGQTIHSFFNFPLGPLDPETAEIPEFKKGGAKRKLIEALELLIIDEISMVRADLLDAIDTSLRLNRSTDLPFGGVTVVAFGDIWQLEPVVRSGAESEFLAHHYNSPFFFDSHVAKEVGMDVHELRFVHRQATDQEMLYALDQIRMGNPEQLDFFNSRVGAKIEGARLVLTATNARANVINSTQLMRLPSPILRYEARIDGDFGKELPTDQHLQIKKGSQVMFVKNGKQWMNGTLGEVVNANEDEIQVKIYQGETVLVRRELWEKSRYTWNRDTSRITAEPIGSFVQFPLRLAWAVTIHKSQGLTFDRLVLDMDRPAFAHGQIYVALSRCRRSDGLSLMRPIKAGELQVSGSVLEFAKKAGLEK